jgi:hypothetical protein
LQLIEEKGVIGLGFSDISLLGGIVSGFVVFVFIQSDGIFMDRGFDLFQKFLVFRLGVQRVQVMSSLHHLKVFEKLFNNQLLVPTWFSFLSNLIQKCQNLVLMSHDGIKGIFSTAGGVFEFYIQELIE